MRNVVRQVFFHAVAWTPLLLLVIGLLFFTNLPQTIYTDSIRNIYFDCLAFVEDDYVYKAKPGPCRLQNVEFDTVIHHNSDGFRNSEALPDYQIAVLGDSMAHGWGVRDDQTFSYLLGSQYHYPALNLAIGSYATKRELDAFSKYGRQAKFVVIQYCDNDFSENVASITLGNDDFKTDVRNFWQSYITRYEEVKAIGYRQALTDVAQKLVNLDFLSKAAWRREVEKRDMEREAAAFAEIIDRYRSALEGRRLIVLEASPWGLNSPRFAATFAAGLDKKSWLKYRIMNTKEILDYADHYFLDGHLNPIGHSKLAAAIAAEIARWRNDER
jgi:hypothetical protein